jgi:hypothetical protein
MSQYAFGSGVLYGRSTNNASLPGTPVRFGGLQGVQFDISFTVKELFGQYQFPIALGRGTGKITGKADWAQINAQAWNDLFFGYNSVATGSVRQAVAEAQTITANAVTVTNNATFVADYGVVLAADNTLFARVAANPIGKQYTCNESTGVYTFNNTQNASAVLVSYSYNDASNGKKISMTNQLLGNAPTFAAVFTETFQGKTITMVLNQCMSSKMALATKLEDFVIPAFDFAAFADSGNNIGSISMDE